MMREFLTPHDVANQARMLRVASRRAILILEGANDARQFAGFIASALCVTVVAHNKSNAIGAIEKLDLTGQQGVLAVVDADFWHLDGVPPPSPNVVVTDTHDIETMAFASEALDKILREFGDPAVISSLKKPVVSAILEAAYPLGMLRWYCQKQKLFLKFDGIKFSSFLDSASLTIDLDQLIAEVKSNSPGVVCDESGTKLGIRVLKRIPPDPLQVCSGHDLVRIFTAGVNHNFGNSRGKKLPISIFEGVLRLAYEYSFFSKTKLYSSIRQWEATNSPFVILR